MSHGKPRVAVVYNEPVLPPGHADSASESDVVAVASAVVGALNGSGFAAAPLAAGLPLSAFLAGLLDAAPDLVFNLAEGFGGRSSGATYLPAVFELAGLPYTGSPVEALAACVSKSRAKALLRGFGLPTAPSLLVGPDGVIPDHRSPWPVVVKPDAEDGSLGIDQGSVVGDPRALAARVAGLIEVYGGSVIVEAYLPGPEFNVGVYAVPEPRALPPAQVVFAPGDGRWPILTYAAKWDEGSQEDRESPVVCPAPIERELARRLADLALGAFAATGCRDYARVDFRLDARGEPVILEVNPNPDVGPGAGWARAARAAGVSYEQAVSAIAGEALKRGPRH